MILVSEADAEAALTVTEHDVGWVVEPGNADELAKTVSRAAGARTRSGPSARPKSPGDSISTRAMADYCGLIRELCAEEAGLA